MGSKGPASRGQKRAAKTKARQKRQNPAGNQPASIPTDLLVDFATWLEQGEMAEHAGRVAGLTGTTLTQMAKANPAFSVTAWTPSDAHYLVDAAERVEDSDPDNGHAAALNIVLCVLEFLAFLDETDAWTGSEDDFAHCMEDLNDFVYNDPDVLEPDDIELPEVTAEEESAALAILPLISGVDALVARVGSSIALADIPDLSAALANADDATDDPAANLTELDYWAAAIASEVLEVKSSNVVPGKNVDAFGLRKVDALRDVLTHHIRHQLTSVEDDVSMALSNTFAIQTLLAAMTDDLPIDNAEEDYEGLEGEDLRTAQLIDYRVRSLQDQTILITAEDALEVPTALRPAVLQGIRLAEPFGEYDPMESS
ncbi:MULTISPECIES: hypothetical protein [unclassified Rhodococcus (in: high G+C Gram-positive bacteria)]|uniref:hypothetical protein n=1 Tax=unclassified Rhodococcus (in: high G+C Gram-positive bacteria) TaxID=192944 RepID=UPI001FF823E6|nr:MULTISPECIES: hypothetical protein [unclassified Rhodococcus (in: high G+C Gram-positive bacteria)]